MVKIIIITKTQSYLMLQLKERFEQSGDSILLVDAKTDHINKSLEGANAMIMYLDEEMSEDSQLLFFVKDKAVEKDIPVFLIGDPVEISTAEKIITKDVVANQFTRPINVNDIVGTVDAHLENFGQKKKVLVVDDSGAMLRNVKGWLENKYTVILANSGAMAIKYLTLNRPDLILLDYEMPICDGKQVLEMIRSEMEFADIPVVFLTSKGDKESVMNVMSLKPEGYLLKTMEPAKIVQYVDDFFEKKKASK